MTSLNSIIFSFTQASLEQGSLQWGSCLLLSRVFYIEVVKMSPFSSKKSTFSITYSYYCGLQKLTTFKKGSSHYSSTRLTEQYRMRILTASNTSWGSIRSRGAGRRPAVLSEEVLRPLCHLTLSAAPCDKHKYCHQAPNDLCHWRHTLSLLERLIIPHLLFSKWARR